MASQMRLEAETGGARSGGPVDANSASPACMNLCPGSGVCETDKEMAMSYVGIAKGDYDGRPQDPARYTYIGGCEGDDDSPQARKPASSPLLAAAAQQLAGDEGGPSRWAVVVGISGGAALLLALLAVAIAVHVKTTTTTVMATTVMTVQYDCNPSPQQSWAVAHQQWCCQNAGTGCSPMAPGSSGSDSQAGSVLTLPTLAPAPMPYDCAAGFIAWRVGWSDHQKHWCCLKFGKGCAEDGSTPASLLFDCKSGVSKWKTGWSTAKQRWCCSQGGRSCS